MQKLVELTLSVILLVVLLNFIQCALKDEFPRNEERNKDMAERGFLDTIGGVNGRLYGDADTDADDGKSETMMEDKRMFDSLGGSAIHGYKRDDPLYKTKRYFDSLGGAFVHGYKKRYFDDLGDMAIHGYRKRYLDTLGGMAVHGEKRGFDTLGGIDVYKRYPKELYEGLVEGTDKRALDSLGGSYIPYGRKRALSTHSGEDIYGYKRGLDTLGGVSVYKKSELEKKAEFDSLGGYAIHRFKRSKSDKTSA
ncbi:hypothetical protein ACJMK2_007335 [Sinanodonta woodiana]|uniref:Uncharacterized protein n=1 Tax=Sinanodonta woodiana TaxID=1069815 RepID=A0ABD3VIG7_SINWO